MKRLIYLEDDEVLAGITIRSMQRRGFEVTHHDSIEAVKGNTKKDHYSHALLDLRLEDGNSLSVIEQLCSSQTDIKILVLTGYASIATAVKAIKLGAVNYLAKPANADQIVKAFEDCEDVGIETEVDDEQLSLKRMEWELIQQALADNDGNVSAAARQLKMHRRTLQRKLAKRPSKI